MHVHRDPEDDQRQRHNQTQGGEQQRPAPNGDRVARLSQGPRVAIRGVGGGVQEIQEGHLRSNASGTENVMFLKTTVKVLKRIKEVYTPVHC